MEATIMFGESNKELIINYNNNEKSGLILNFITDFIKILIGLTQGALLSPWIYITVIGPLAELLEREKTKMGYCLSNVSQWTKLAKSNQFQQPLLWHMVHLFIY